MLYERKVNRYIILYRGFPFNPDARNSVMKARKLKHKNLTRIDHPAKRTHGYFVRIQWKGERRAKFFSDGVYGDRLAALDAALEWRNATEAELGKPRTDRQVV